MWIQDFEKELGAHLTQVNKNTMIGWYVRGGEIFTSPVPFLIQQRNHYFRNSKLIARWIFWQTDKYSHSSCVLKSSHFHNVQKSHTCKNFKYPSNKVTSYNPRDVENVLLASLASVNLTLCYWCRELSSTGSDWLMSCTLIVVESHIHCSLIESTRLSIRSQMSCQNKYRISGPRLQLTRETLKEGNVYCTHKH